MAQAAPSYAELPLITRMGLSADSFKRRLPTDDANNLNQTLKRKLILKSRANPKIVDTDHHL